MSLRIAICNKDEMFNHSESWFRRWLEFCKQEGFDFQVIDPYRFDIIDSLSKFDILVWNPSNYVLADMMESRSIIYAAQRMGICVFPDFNTAWHFDDKIAQSYLLQSINASVPRNWVFYLLDECINWIEKEAQFPIIAKLKSGSGSNNVKMIRSKNEALTYAKRMFGKGFSPAPSFIYKAKSKWQSSHNWETFINRVRRIPEFLHTLSRAKKFPNEHGYAYFQEFIPNDGYDLKVVVIGEKVCGFSRKNRKGDFRASGGGDIVYDKSLVTEQVRYSALEVSKTLGFQCMGFDYVVDNRTGNGLIVEMCYGFSNDALLGAGGYWDSDNHWIDKPISAPAEILKNLIQERWERGK